MNTPHPLPDGINSIIQIHSGGFDSTTLLYWLRAKYPDITIRTLTIDYGQKMRKELEAARRISNLLKIEHRVANLQELRQFFGDSSLVSATQSAPAGNQWDKSMMANMVPNRNMLMLSVASAWAFATKTDAITYGCHEENYALDSQWPFIHAMQDVIQKADWHKVQLLTPLMGMSKADQVAMGMQLNIPYQLTWSCYRGGEIPCGVCGACVRRLEGFWYCGEEDPANYQDREGWKLLSDKHPSSLKKANRCEKCADLGYDIETQTLCDACNEAD